MNYFITGVTGNVGSTIVRRLLKHESAKLWILMRAASADELNSRLNQFLPLWTPDDSDQDAVRSRLRPLRGDMSKPRFGLSAADWDEVVEHCSVLIHAAGVVRMNLAIEDARDHAVGSARNLMDLADSICIAGRTPDVAYVSTVGVIGKQSAPLRPEWVGVSQGFHNTYEQAKAEAEVELRLRHAARQEIRLSVHRPSMVVGASDGRLLRHQVFYYLCEFLSGRHTKGLIPDLAGVRLDTVPVGFVADAVVWAVHHPQPGARIFNLCSGPDHEVPLLQVQEWVRASLGRAGAALPRMRVVPAKVFRWLMAGLARVLGQKAAKRLGTLPVLLDYLESPQVFDGKDSRLLLEQQANLVLPDPGAYLPDIIRSYYSGTEDRTPPAR